jgi:hypothetical protein
MTGVLLDQKNRQPLLAIELAHDVENLIGLNKVKLGRRSGYQAASCAAIASGAGRQVSPNFTRFVLARLRACARRAGFYEVSLEVKLALDAAERGPASAATISPLDFACRSKG